MARASTEIRQPGIKMPAAFRMLTKKPDGPEQPDSRLPTSLSSKSLRNLVLVERNSRSDPNESAHKSPSLATSDINTVDGDKSVSTDQAGLVHDGFSGASVTSPESNSHGATASYEATQDKQPSTDMHLTKQKTASDPQRSQIGSISTPPATFYASSSQLELSLQNSRKSASILRSSMDLKVPSQRKASERDRYGFKKKTNFISEAEYDAWWDSYQNYLKRRKRKWVAFMKESGLSIEDDSPVRFPAKSEKLKRYVRKGIPAEWRGNAWWWYAKGPEKLSMYPDLYAKLCKQTISLKNNDTELIERDLNRTFPDNIYFRGDASTNASNISLGDGSSETPLISALRRVLRSFAVYQPSVGYCQSLNFIAGILLLFMDEEKAFWMLVIMTQKYLPGLHEISLEGVNIEQGVLMLFIKQTLPEIWDKVGVNFEGQQYDNVLIKLPPITLCTASWFMSAYISILPTETMLRVWDCFFLEDTKVFFRVALTLLKMVEPDVRNLTDQMEIFQTIQNYPKKMIDASKLMENCFKRRNGFSNISQTEIVKLRGFVADRRKKAEQGAHREALANGGVKNYQPSEDGVLAGLTNTDLEAFSKLKPLHLGFQANVARRMKSLSHANHNRESRILSRRISSVTIK